MCFRGACLCLPQELFLAGIRENEGGRERRKEGGRERRKEGRQSGRREEAGRWE